MGIYLCRLLYSDGRSRWLLVKEDEFLPLLKQKDPLLISHYEIPDWLFTLFSKLRDLASGRVKTEELIDFAKSMSVMLRAGISVVYAIEDYADMTGNRLLKKTLLDVAERVRAGESLSEALARHPRVFPEVFSRVVRIGEETGSLEQAFADIAAHLERVLELRNGIKKALMYPSFVMVTTFGALVFWLIYVMPKIVGLFERMNLSLPTITIFIVEFSRFVMGNIQYILAAVVLIIVACVIAVKKSRRAAYAFHWLLLRLPIVKLVLNYFQLAFIADYLRLLVMSGANIDRALELVAQGVGNLVYREALFKIKEKVVMGESLSSSFSEFPLFPRFFIRMLKSGEESGTLDEQMKFAADTYYEKLRDLTEKMGKMIEPIVLIVVGGLFAIIMVSLLFPIYQLIGNMGRM